MKRLAVERVGTAFVDWKKLPRFRLLSKTVGGRVSLGAILANSTEGRGNSSSGDSPEIETLGSIDGGETAVVGNGFEEDTLLSSEGRGWVSAVLAVPDFVLRRVALDTLERRLFPMARAVSP